MCICRKATLLIVLIMIVQMACLEGCSDPEPVAKSSFGKVDAMQDGKVLSSTRADTAGEETESSEEKDITDDKPIKSARSLDVNRLPADIRMMAGLCDAINMACVEQRKVYSQTDNEFMWHSVHLFVGNCTDKQMGFRRVGNTIEAEPEVIGKIMFAMFGKLREIPPISDESADEDEDERPHISVSTDLKYRFSDGDRGTSAPEIRSVTEYSDSSVEMEVALVDEETGDETVSFIYTMRANTRDTSNSALIDYEITGARPADRITSDKMNGIPYLVPVIQIYGQDTLPEDDPRYGPVEEVLIFTSFDEHVPGMEELNANIAKNVLARSDASEDGSVSRIISYPITTDDYVQVAMTVTPYPLQTTDPDIYCYNYNKSKQRAMDMNDALMLSGMKNPEMLQRVEDLFALQNENAEISDITYRGFMVRRDNSVDMFYMIGTEGAGETDGDHLMVYNSGTDELRYAFENGYVYPDDEIDQMMPKLTHGRKAGTSNG